MTFKRVLLSFRKQTEGATAVEFAIVASIFFFMMFVVIEFGMYMFSRSVVESAATMASRAASIASAPYPGFPQCATDPDGPRVCVARETARKKAGGLARADQMSFTMNLLSQGAPTPPEYCISAGAFCSTTVDCSGGSFKDDNNNGTCDTGSGSNTLSNNGGGTVVMTIQYPYQLFLPIPGIQNLFGNQLNQTSGGSTSGGNTLIIKATTVIRNEND